MAGVSIDYYPGIFIYPVSLFIYYTVFYDTNIQPKNLDYCIVL